MKKFAVAAIAATVMLAVAAPAVADETHHERHVVKKVIHRDHGRHLGWREGRHEGWRHHHGTKVVIKHGHGKTVIKKHEG